ncbi:MAG: LysM peptidoglycan-binding domain-containing protein, partial [Enterobacteriaceae bacterium]
ISNYGEERLLMSVAHQEKIAKAIYQGVRNYYLANPIQPERPSEKKPAFRALVKNDRTASPPQRISQVKSPPTFNSKRRHTVQRGDTLSGIAVKYGVSMAELKRANKLTADTAILGQRLIIP